MHKSVEKYLEDANKLIFVKRYSDAERLLDETLESAEGRGELLVHLRRIELAAMLKKLDRMRSYYLRLLKANKSPEIYEIALALTEQHGEMVTPVESITNFQDLIKKHGPSAACYYGIGYAMEHQGNFDRAIFNYEQSLSIDPSWHIAYFGLSQIFYQMGNEKRGDHYFFLFEQAAPYNVYGNFETHRKLCQEYLETDHFLEAEAAIQALSE